MNCFSKSVVYFGISLATLSSSVFGSATTADEGCDLTQAMGQRRIEAQQRRIEATDAGIIETNQAAIENLPEISAATCTDKIYEMMDFLQSKMQSPLGSIISSSLGNQISSMINNMTCAEAERYYREVMGSKIAEIDDRFGILRSGGQITGYDEGRSVSYDLGDAVELGRKASEAAKTLPSSPPGRGAVTSSPQTSDAARSAVNGL